MANTIIESTGLPPGGFDYALGTGWIPYLLGMEELPGKEQFQRASIGTDLFKSLTDFMINPTAGPLGLAATAAYGGPQGISAGTGGKGLPELGAYRSRFNTLLDNLMRFSGTMNAQPEDTQYVAPPIDPNKAPAPSPENAAKAPNMAADWIRAWNAFHPNDQKPVPLKYGGIVEMMLPKPVRKMQDGGEKELPTGTPTPTPTPGGPVPTTVPPPPIRSRIVAPEFEGSTGEADPMAAFGGRDLVEAMQRYVSEGGDANQFIKTVKAIAQLADMVREGKIVPYTGQPPIPGRPPRDFLTMGPDVIKRTLEQYGPQVGLAHGGGVVVGGQPHYVVDSNGYPVAAITEDGKPEAVTGTRDGFEVTPLDPARYAAYQDRKRQEQQQRQQQDSMGMAIADAEDFIARMTRPTRPTGPVGMKTGAKMMLPTSTTPKTYVGDSLTHPSGVPVPTIGGPSRSREEQVGGYFKPKTGPGAPTLMEQMSKLGGDYNEQYARLLGGALSSSNMAIPAEQLRAFNEGRAPDKLLSAQALRTMSPTQRKGYAAMLQQMGIIQSADDLDYFVDQFRPAGLKEGGRMRLGGGGRFDKLVASLEGDVEDPAAVAASIGRKKYGAKKMAKMAARGRKRSK